MLNVVRFVFNNFGENTYLLIDSNSKDGAVVDPGMSNLKECQLFDEYILKNNIRLTQIILTHGHIDHCLGAISVKNKYGAFIKACSKDLFLALQFTEQANRFGIIYDQEELKEFDVNLQEGDIVLIGSNPLKVIQVAGHSPGGIILYSGKDGFALVGDSIFKGSIGRTDLEGGDYETLITNLKAKVLSLPDSTILLPGHGEPTTIMDEKKSNPFLR